MVFDKLLLFICVQGTIRRETRSTGMWAICSTNIKFYLNIASKYCIVCFNMKNYYHISYTLWLWDNAVNVKFTFLLQKPTRLRNKYMKKIQRYVVNLLRVNCSNFSSLFTDLRLYSFIISFFPSSLSVVIVNITRNIWLFILKRIYCFYVVSADYSTVVNKLFINKYQQVSV